MKERIFEYNTWDYLGYDRKQEISEFEILDRYWNFWSEHKMKDRDPILMTKEACIQDWVKENWAWEKK